MKGYLVQEFGGPEVMQWTELPTPKPGPGEVRVAIAASGINFAETRMRAGTYTGQSLPFVMGMEGAGTVEAIGPGVTTFAPGDRVFGRARGAHAEACLFKVEHLMPLPDRLNFVEGAAIPVGWLTAWHALMTVAALRPGQRVLIEAVASSVGSAALQIAKWRDAWVAGTASRDDKLVHATAAGADAVYNYKTEDIAANVARDTNGKGIDVGLMTIGEETSDGLLASMGMDGKVVMYGSTGGRRIAFGLAIGERNLQLLAMSITSSPGYVPETLLSFRAQALPLFANGGFVPVVDTVLAMSEVARAHQMVDDRSHFGKIILQNE